MRTGSFERHFRKMLDEDTSLESSIDKMNIDDKADDAEMSALETALRDDNEEVSQQDKTTAASQIAQARKALVQSVTDEISSFDGKLSKFIETINQFGSFLIDAENEESVRHFVMHNEMFSGENANASVAKSKNAILASLNKAAIDCALLAQTLTSVKGSFIADEIVAQQLADATES